jgi:hypothetical protein
MRSGISSSSEPGELVVEAFRIVAGVGLRAFGEQHARDLAGPPALGRRREGRRRDLVRREAGPGRAPDHLRHDPGQRLRPAALRRAIGHRSPRAVPARHVPGIGEAPVDGPDRVRVDAQRGAQLANGQEARARQQTARIDLVDELPVDLGGDRDVRVPGNVEVPAGWADRPAPSVDWYG